MIKIWSTYDQHMINYDTYVDVVFRILASITKYITHNAWLQILAHIEQSQKHFACEHAHLVEFDSWIRWHTPAMREYTFYQPTSSLFGGRTIGPNTMKDQWLGVIVQPHISTNETEWIWMASIDHPFFQNKNGSSTSGCPHVLELRTNRKRHGSQRSQVASKECRWDRRWKSLTPASGWRQKTSQWWGENYVDVWWKCRELGNS